MKSHIAKVAAMRPRSLCQLIVVLGLGPLRFDGAMGASWSYSSMRSLIVVAPEVALAAPT
jgi:hypothetical protein